MVRAALLLIVTALGCATVPPTETATPTNSQPTATASRPATSPVAPPPTASQPPPGATPTPAVLSQLDRILAHVPGALSCGSLVPGSAGTASVSCSAAGGVDVTYTLYPDTDSLRRAYADVFARARIERETGNCARPETWPAEGAWSGAGGSGRYVCIARGGNPKIYWTIDEAPIMAVANRADGDADRLWQFWLYESAP